MLSEPDAAALVEELDLARVPACPLCLFELAWAKHQGSVEHGVLRRTTSSMWPEIRQALAAAVVEARMREVPQAEDALRDLAERGRRGIVARHVVSRLAEDLAEQFDA